MSGPKVDLEKFTKKTNREDLTWRRRCENKNGKKKKKRSKSKLKDLKYFQCHMKITLRRIAIKGRTNQKER